MTPAELRHVASWLDTLNADGAHWGYGSAMRLLDLRNCVTLLSFLADLLEGAEEKSDETDGTADDD